MPFHKNQKVRLNVGGKIFETTATTLAIAGRESYFGAISDENWYNPAGGEHFIDRNPDCFSIILDLLRTGELYIPPNIPERLFYREVEFYGLMNLVRSAKWVKFDGNRLHLSKSIRGYAQSDSTAIKASKLIRASPDGGCCVAHGTMVHVYDWRLEEHPTINIDYKWVYDACWIGSFDPTGLVISTCVSHEGGQGGMGLFNFTTGELKHKFNVTHKGATGGALTFDGVCNLFSSFKCNDEYGIGVWDQNTGQQDVFFYKSLGLSLGYADRLQWLNGLNCLLVATLYPRKKNSYISLVDLRSKSVPWSWSDLHSVIKGDDRRVWEAVVMEESNSICVVNEFEDLGFLDMRVNSGFVKWNPKDGLMKRKTIAEPDYPKLVLHEGQLFSSRNDCISLYNGSNWVLTSQLRSLRSDIIRDFSIGGNRLFALHSWEDVFDIWETPQLAIA